MHLKTALAVSLSGPVRAYNLVVKNPDVRKPARGMMFQSSTGYVEMCADFVLDCARRWGVSPKALDYSVSRAT